MKIIKALSLTLFVFGLVGWLYIVLSATFHPETLSWQLTHLAPWPREDTFGIACFAVSMISFFVWNMVKDKK
jgi:hypothetical protein